MLKNKDFYPNGTDKNVIFSFMSGGIDFLKRARKKQKKLTNQHFCAIISKVESSTISTLNGDKYEKSYTSRKA